MNSVLLNECQSNATAERNCITTLTLKDETGSQIAPTNYIYPITAFKNVILPVANISVSICLKSAKMNDKHLYLTRYILFQVNLNYDHLPGIHFNYPDIEFELLTDNIALFVWLEAGNIRGRFSENGFHMFETKKRVIFHAFEAITPDVLKDNLKVITLSDIYDSNRKDAKYITIN